MENQSLNYYLPLYKAIIKNTWNEATQFLSDDSSALTARITIYSQTALHVAVGACGSNATFVENLIRNMSTEDLVLTDRDGDTALSVAAMVGNLDVAKLLVNKSAALPNIAGQMGFPVHRAAQYGHKDMTVYLLGVTSADIHPNPFDGQIGVKLLVYLVIAEFYDVALDLLKKYPHLATIEHEELGYPLNLLAEKPHAFPSGSYLNTQPSVLKPFSYVKSIQDRRRMHRHAIDLVKYFCTMTLGSEVEHGKAFIMLQQPLHTAARLGVHEVVEAIIDAFPVSLWLRDDQEHDIFELAVIHRREKVFNLIYQMTDFRQLVTSHMDPHKNNILHLAGRLPPSDRLNIVSGAVLQMQREIQWFQEVKKFVQPAFKVGKNDGKTPDDVFFEAHQNLIKEGEKWMKDTATSFTVAAGLIAGVSFSGSITVPGGLDSDGVPIRHQQTAFAIYGTCDVISLSSSVTSIMMFTSILTSRYAQSDFQSALPKRLLFGLMALLIAIASMMVAFTTAMYLVFGH